MTRKLSLAFLLLTFATSLLAETTQRYMVVTREGVAPGFSPARDGLKPAATFERRVRTFERVRSFAVDLTAEEAEELRRSGDVESVEPVVRIQILGFEAKPVANAVYTKQVTPWGVAAIHAPDVWPVTKGSKVNVVVVDTGVDTTHPDLVHAYAGGTNTVIDGEPVTDDHGHGTHVAGTIAAAHNGFGVVGVAPNAKLWAVKALDKFGYGTDETLVAGIDWAIAKKKELGGTWIVNMSIGAPDGTQAEHRAVAEAISAGVFLVAASGNDGGGKLNYPAAIPGVLSVGAVDSDLAVTEFSTYGPGLTIVAPGLFVPSSVVRNTYLEADIQLPSQVLQAFSVTGSPRKNVSGEFVYCGYGRPEDFLGSVQGKIAVMKRGPIPPGMYFRDKVKNAKERGAIAAVIFNDDDLERSDYAKWSLIASSPEWPGYEFPLTIAMSNANGERLLQNIGAPITMSSRYEDYAVMSGTSMATPHVTGTLALLLSLAPHTNLATIEWALRQSANDVHLEGWDLRTSWGMIDALGAAKLIAPAAFGETPTTPPPARRRSARP